MHELMAAEYTHLHQTVASASPELRQTLTAVAFCLSAPPEQHSSPSYLSSFSSLSLLVAVSGHNQHPSVTTHANQQRKLFPCSDNAGYKNHSTIWYEIGKKNKNFINMLALQENTTIQVT